MALIRCPECGAQVSDSADRCPYCRHDMHELDIVDIGLTAFWLFKFLWAIIKYYVAPMLCSLTWVSFLLYLPNPISLSEGQMFVMAALWISFLPYWYRLFKERNSEKLANNMIFSFYWKWFLKGPFAYKDLKEYLGD